MTDAQAVAIIAAILRASPAPETSGWSMTVEDAVVDAKKILELAYIEVTDEP